VACGQCSATLPLCAPLRNANSAQISEEATMSENAEQKRAKTSKKLHIKMIENSENKSLESRHRKHRRSPKNPFKRPIFGPEVSFSLLNLCTKKFLNPSGTSKDIEETS